MPLAFTTAAGNTIPFGFFNIESDMLLLDRTFFFCTDFCDWINALADPQIPALRPIDVTWPVYRIEDPEDIGDLMLAIHGARHVGFLGKTYLAYPFPAAPEDFKQNPEGHQTRAELEKMITPYATQIEVPVHVQASTGTISVGEHTFTCSLFAELLDYVWRGGYPRWRDDRMPDYVARMKERVQTSEHWLFKDA